MTHLKVRIADVKDAPELLRFMRATPRNLFDERILNYPTLGAVCAYDGDGPVAYLPFQNGLVLESLAVKPGTDFLAAANAFRTLVQSAELVASQRQIKEMYFLCEDESVIGLAAKHGFEVLPWKTLRMKL